MKQKIVIRVVGMNDEKSRCKSLKTVVGLLGVDSAAVKGDQVEVVGEIDAVCLTRALRKNVAPADLISVEEHKKKEEKKDDKLPVVFFPQSHYPTYEVRPEPYCTIM